MSLSLNLLKSFSEDLHNRTQNPNAYVDKICEWPGHWIDGTFVTPPKSKNIKSILNPNSGKKILEINLDRSIYSKVHEPARRAQETLFKISPNERQFILKSIRQALVEWRETLLSSARIDAGKTYQEAEKEFSSALSYLDFFLENNLSDFFGKIFGEGSQAFKTRELNFIPGQCALCYLPFSAPISTFVSYVTAAVVTGCPCVIVPSGHASLTALSFAHILSQVEEIPKGFIQILFGDFQLFKTLLSDKAFDVVAFIGSRDHCEDIRKESFQFSSRHLYIQSGGKNAVIINESADIDSSIDLVLESAYSSAGQLCSSASRLIAHENIFHKFIDRLVDKTKALKIARTDHDKNSQLGPLFSPKAQEKFLRFQTMANRESEQTLLWGKTLDLGHSGFFVNPGIHVLSQFDASSPYQSNVIFGPDLAVYRFQSFEDAIKIANATDSSFYVSILSEKVLEKNKLRYLNAPIIFHNKPTTFIESHAPLSGKEYCGHERHGSFFLPMFFGYPQILLG